MPYIYTLGSSGFTKNTGILSSSSEQCAGCQLLTDCYRAPCEVSGKAETILQRIKVGAAVRPGGLHSTAPDAKVPSLSDVELDFQRSVQAVLRELNTPSPALQSNQGKSWSRTVLGWGFPAWLSARGRGFSLAVCLWTWKPSLLPGSTLLVNMLRLYLVVDN